MSRDYWFSFVINWFLLLWIRTRSKETPGQGTGLGFVFISGGAGIAELCLQFMSARECNSPMEQTKTICYIAIITRLTHLHHIWLIYWLSLNYHYLWFSLSPNKRLVKKTVSWSRPRREVRFFSWCSVCLKYHILSIFRH